MPRSIKEGAIEIKENLDVMLLNVEDVAMASTCLSCDQTTGIVVFDLGLSTFEKGINSKLSPAALENFFSIKA